jgi:hypothetical protein
MDVRSARVNVRPWVAGGDPRFWVIHLVNPGSEEYDGEDGYGLALEHVFDDEDCAERVADKIRDAGEIDPGRWSVGWHGCVFPDHFDCGCPQH